MFLGLALDVPTELEEEDFRALCLDLLQVSESCRKT